MAIWSSRKYPNYPPHGNKGKKNKVALVKFFNQSSPLPVEYIEAYLCYRFRLTYDELTAQPDEWVNQMVEIMTAESKAQEHQSKIAGAKAKR